MEGPCITLIPLIFGETRRFMAEKAGLSLTSDG
jgi:hypothetical protein